MTRKSEIQHVKSTEKILSISIHKEKNKKLRMMYNIYSEYITLHTRKLKKLQTFVVRKIKQN